MWVTIIPSVLLVLAASLYFYVKKRYSYFKDRGVKSIPPLPFIGSNWRSLFFLKHFLDDLNDGYKAFPDEKYFGIYEGLKPALAIRDPELIKKVTVKDFEHFIDHRNVLVRDDDDEGLISKAMLFLKGQKWRDMRGALSPAFTGSKMRMMLPFMTEISEQVIKFLKTKSKDGTNGNSTEPMELYDLFTRIANDIIASCAFGLKVDSLKDKDNEFYSMGKLVTTFKKFKFFMVMLSPRLSKLLGIKIFPEESTDFFRNVVSGAMKHRADNKIVRHDMIHLLMEAKIGNLKHGAQKSDDAIGFATVQESNQNGEKRQWTDDELAAQAFIFFFAGFDTTATALTFLAHELTINTDIQEKLRSEIDACQSTHPNLNYEVIQGLKYMDMVLSESLRKWASAVVLDRLCVKEYTLDPPHPGGKPFTFKPKDYLYVYVNAMHRDEKYYPDPEKFDPERFSDERKQDIKPFTYMPFGSGPRNCIGSRFALMELKVILYQLLLNFELVACEKTTNPMKLASGLKLAVENGSWVQFRPRM